MNSESRDVIIFMAWYVALGITGYCALLLIEWVWAQHRHNSRKRIRTNADYRTELFYRDDKGISDTYFHVPELSTLKRDSRAKR